MKNIKITLSFSLLAAAWLPGGARAAYDDVGVGARVTGMGNAFTAVADDVYSVYYNPAGLGTLERPELATTYSKLLTGLSDNSNLQNSFLAYEHPIAQGRQGAYGVAWNYFTLDNLYRETSLYGSYGRRIFAEQVPNGLYAGMSLKYLSRALGKVSAADNSFTNTGQVQVGVPDPVLQKGSQSNIDTDIGLLYRVRPRFTLGLAVQHLLEPNIAISDSDTDVLGRNVKLGAAYQTPWTTFSTDLDFMHAPNGATDRVLTLAAEKWLPTLLFGTFGVRGSLGAGDRQYRQATVGLSYRIHRFQVDYGFGIPLGTITNTLGTHRIGLSFRFGHATGAEAKFSDAILENMSGLGEVGTLEFRARSEDLARYLRTAQAEFLRQARVDAGQARFADAKEKLYQALSLNAADKELGASLEKMSLVAGVFPEIPGYQTEPSMAALYVGILDFLSGKGQEAAEKLSYAQSLNPGDARLERLLKLIEEKTGLRPRVEVLVSTPAAAPVQVAVSSPAAQVSVSSSVVQVAVSSPAAIPAAAVKADEIERDLALGEVALWEKNYDKAIELSKKVLEKDPKNTLAYKRIARAYFEKKDYIKALETLQNVAKLEADPDVRHSLETYMGALQSLIERKTHEVARPAPAVPAKAAPGDPAQIRRLYEAGVDLYSQGRLSEAMRSFQKILELDPKNKSATQALRHVEEEIRQGSQ